MFEVAEEVPEPEEVSLPDEMSLPEITFEEDSSDDWANSILESLEKIPWWVDFVWLVGCVPTIFRCGFWLFLSCFGISGLTVPFTVFANKGPLLLRVFATERLSHLPSLQTRVFLLPRVFCYREVLLLNDCPTHRLCKRKSSATEVICFWEFLLPGGPLVPRVFASEGLYNEGFCCWEYLLLKVLATEGLCYWEYLRLRAFKFEGVCY